MDIQIGAEAELGGFGTLGKSDPSRRMARRVAETVRQARDEVSFVRVGGPHDYR
jgi:hypothetical protein